MSFIDLRRDAAGRASEPLQLLLDIGQPGQLFLDRPHFLFQGNDLMGVGHQQGNDLLLARCDLLDRLRGETVDQVQLKQRPVRDRFHRVLAVDVRSEQPGFQVHRGRDPIGIQHNRIITKRPRHLVGGAIFGPDSDFNPPPVQVPLDQRLDAFTFLRRMVKAGERVEGVSQALDYGRLPRSTGPNDRVQPCAERNVQAIEEAANDGEVLDALGYQIPTHKMLQKSSLKRTQWSGIPRGLCRCNR
jgi:hypothetical protein